MTLSRRGDLRAALYRIADGFVEVVAILDKQEEKRTPTPTEAKSSAVPTEIPPALTVREAADLLRVSRNSVYEAVATDRIPSVRIGKRILIPGGALQRFLNPDSGGSWHEVADRPHNSPSSRMLW